MNVMIRQAVSPDIDYLARFEHCVKSECVWQMSQNVTDGQTQTIFTETHLPREMRVVYPRSPDTLENRWKNYASLLVACLDNAPVGYVSINVLFAPDLIWINDLVIDEIWRRKGIAMSLFQAVRDWGMARKYMRVMLEMSSKNYPAICYSKKLGFEFTGYNDSYFSNNDIALFFSRNLK
jgi:GNAT superfamily N-acetyltransferase